jgi:choice-of-anchor B domain-containing protein
MKHLSLVVILIFLGFGHAQTPCNNGFAAGFPCSGYDLQSQIPLTTMNSTRANDSWGWTDPTDGKEYAIICLIEGTAFIDISDPLNPIYLGQLPTENNSSTWRDAKTYNDHVFVVSEDSGHGMQVFDLTRLRDVTNPPVVFSNDAHFSGFGSAHNIVINEETGFAYAVGTSAFGGGAYFVNIQDPLNPVAAGGYASQGYTHDAQVVIYNGPDNTYAGRELLIGSNEDELVIVDVTDKGNPIAISSVNYPNVSYTHQGWFTEDQRYFILGDETDEINFGFDTRTIIIDMQDLDNPQLHFTYTGFSAATDHNGYVKGDKFYLSNNAAGLRVIDISDIENQNMEEIGYFDTYSADNAAGFNGAWSVYPYFESGNIVISDRTSGFILVKESDVLGQENFESPNFSIVPNPIQDVFTINSETEPITNITIFDSLGHIIESSAYNSMRKVSMDLSAVSEGIYFIRINNNFTAKLLKTR